MRENELNPHIMALLNRDVTIVVIATVDADGSPRTAPFGWVYAKNQTCLRFATSRGHDTYKNIVRDGRVMICLLEEGNTTLSIQGHARVSKAAFDCTPHMAMIEVNVTAIKSDVTRVGHVITGINAEVHDRFLTMMHDVYAEMMS